MSQPAATLLSQLEDAIYGIQQALIDHGVQEYYIGSRRVRRAEFGATLRQLYEQRRGLIREINSSSLAGRRVRVAKFGTARGVER